MAGCGCFVLMGAAGIAGFGAFAGLRAPPPCAGADRRPSLLRNRAFTSGLRRAVCFFVAMIGLNLVLSLYLPARARVSRRCAPG